MNMPRSPSRWLVAAALGLIALPAMALKPFTAQYSAKYMGVEANAVMTLASAGGDRWKYALSIRNPVANLSQVTMFEDNGGQWRPLSGSDVTNLLVRKKTKNASFDWAKREARWSGDVNADRAGPVALQDGDLDAMLMHLALVRDATSGRALNYRLIENGKAMPMSYRNAGKEAVTVGGKSYSATKLVRSGDDKQLTVWIVDGLPAPARILQTKNGEEGLDLRLTSVN